MPGVVTWPVLPWQSWREKQFGVVESIQGRIKRPEFDFSSATKFFNDL